MNLRALPALQPLRQRRPSVIVCQDDAQQFEAARSAFHSLGAELVLEHDPGPLSDVLGRPSVAVCDRYLEVSLHGRSLSVQQVLDQLEFQEMWCPECPQAADELVS